MPSVFGKNNCELLIQTFGWGKSRNGVIQQSESMNKLKGMLAPFVLRRLKRDVLDQLSDKLGILLKLEMTDFQKQVYENLLCGHANRKENLRLKYIAETEKNKVLDGSKTKKNDKKKESNSAPIIDLRNDFSGGESNLKELSPSEANHLFTALRKAANHPLLLRVRYKDEKVLERIAKVG
jgi:SWI/SNF-related matrix-associated actin-dependent regulator 1 of chromatin subfamily A